VLIVGRDVAVADTAKIGDDDFETAVTNASMLRHQIRLVSG
jgi:hypothetical protein